MFFFILCDLFYNNIVHAYWQNDMTPFTYILFEYNEKGQTISKLCSELFCCNILEHSTAYFLY